MYEPHSVILCMISIGQRYCGDFELVPGDHFEIVKANKLKLSPDKMEVLLMTGRSDLDWEHLLSGMWLSFA